MKGCCLWFMADGIAECRITKGHDDAVAASFCFYACIGRFGPPVDCRSDDRLFAFGLKAQGSTRQHHDALDCPAWKVDQPTDKPIIQTTAKNVRVDQCLMGCQGGTLIQCILHGQILTRKDQISIFFYKFFRLHLSNGHRMGQLGGLMEVRPHGMDIRGSIYCSIRHPNLD